MTVTKASGVSTSSAGARSVSTTRRSATKVSLHRPGLSSSRALPIPVRVRGMRCPTCERIWAPRVPGILSR